MHSEDRLHALDAVRAFALLSGIALHATQPFVAGLPWLTAEVPSKTLAGVFFSIHMVRMPLFFLIAGFFGRMMLARRGVSGFLKDRGRRILVPLIIGVPVIMVLTGLCYVLGALASGADPHALQGLQPPASNDHHGILARTNLIHLWFLYYLLIFYVVALGIHATLRNYRRLNGAVERGVTFLTHQAWGAIVLALPIAVYFDHLAAWSPWGGLPAPMSVIPDVGALCAFGPFFGFGWLLHRQQPLLQYVEKNWLRNALIAAAAWVICRTLAGTTPHWGHFLQGSSLADFCMAYFIAAWYGSFAVMGVAMRFMANFSPTRRYLADSSYWLYLMHIPALIFFQQLLHPLPWSWTIKYPLAVGSATLVLLLSYRYFVRFTFIGATLNGHRKPKLSTAMPAIAAAD